LAGLVAHLHAWGAWAPIVYLLVYAAVVIAMLPAWPLTIAAGAIFGFWLGAVTAFAGAVAGSSGAFLLARYGARGQVVRRFGRSPRFAALDLAIHREGRRIVFLLRMSPLVPFNVVNYLLGLTTLRFRDYLLASVGMTPVTIMYAYGGFVAGEALALSGQAAVPRNASYYAVLVLGLAATILATALVTRAARRAIIDLRL
jgi:uncharacterized membrane protein YdjX (TVP38/TMEM64 family)